MRISKDKTSWHASSIIRRDFRHDKSTPEIPRTRGGKKMVEYQHICISCGHVSKRKTIPEGEEKEWGIENG